MRTSRLPAPPVVLLALAAAAVGTAAREPVAIPVWVDGHGPADETPLPVRVGVPLPRGRATASASWQAVLPDGARRPVQTAVLERWPDGSARWLATDFVLPASPGGRTRVQLQAADRTAPGPTIQAAPGPPITIRSTHLAIAVTPSGGVSLRLLGTPAPDVVVDPVQLDTGRDDDARVRAIRVVSPGPVRAEIVVERERSDGLATTTQLVAWAGASDVLLRHRVVNRGVAPAASLRAMPLTLHVPGLDRAEALVDGTPRALSVGDARASLRQPSAHDAMDGDERIGSHLDGGVLLRASSVAVGVVVPDFWQQYPTALAVARDQLVVDLVAGGARSVDLGIGAAKTHDVWLRLSRPEKASDLADLTRRLQAPPSAVPSPRWTVASGAMPGVVDAEAAPVAAFLARLRSDALRYDSRARHERWDAGPPGPCAARTAARPHTGFFGMLNWGDWNFPGYRDDAKECDAWGNLEYDLPWVFGLAWASTGDPTWATWFERALRHYRDVDVIHAAPDHPEWVGLNHPHKVGHFDWNARAKIDLGHVWLEGLLLHHRLTGDAASADAALAMARALAPLTGKARNARQAGWPMIALAAAAGATGRPELRDAALAYARAAIGRFEADPDAGDWKLGVLASGLAAVHRVTGDADARDWLARYGARVLARERPEGLDPRYLAVAGYLATLTGDPAYARLAASVASEMPIGNWGKTLAMHGRVGFELLAFAPATGATP